MRIKNFKKFELITESAVRMPVDIEYWKRKGKSGKDVALYSHDDMDGIFTAIEMKNWLLSKGFNIVKYGILNYTDGWKHTTLDPKLINVVLDFANMPGDERDELVDYYLDHHGTFTPEQEEKYKNSPVKKLHTASAYEAVLIALGLPQDQLKTDAIDMIDAAKYDQYKVSWQRLLNFDIPDMINFAKKSISRKADLEDLLKKSPENTIQLRSEGELVIFLQDFFDIEPNGVFDEETEKAVKKFQLNNSLKTDKDPKFGVVDSQTWSAISRKFSFKGRLEFAAAFNQFLKRADTKTIISVIENCKNVSIYNIYNVMSKVSPYHNIPQKGPNKGVMTDFKTDAQERLGKMQKMTRGKSTKKVYPSRQEFLKDFQSGNKIDLSGQGYQLIGNLAFVPTGTWANALRVRSIIEKDFMDGVIAKEPDFVLLQYGGTLQVCSYKPISKIQNLPVLKSKGTVVNDLGVYMTGLLNDFQDYFGYVKPKKFLKAIKSYLFEGEYQNKSILQEQTFKNEGISEDTNEIIIYFTGNSASNTDVLSKVRKEINDFLDVYNYYISPRDLKKLMIDKLNLNEEDVTDETTKDNCIIIKLRGKDLLKVYISDDGGYDYVKNSVNFNSRFYLSTDFSDKNSEKKSFDLEKFEKFLQENGLSLSDVRVGIDEYVKKVSQSYNVNYIAFPNSSNEQDEITVSGGHGGIGSISNIFGQCVPTPTAIKNDCVGSRFIDMFKNKIITDLSGVNFKINTKWGEKSESKMKEPDKDYKVVPTEKITKIDKYGNVYIPERVMSFKSFNKK